MDWQQWLSLVIVAAAAVLLVWGRARRRRWSFERETHCGCAAAGQPAAVAGSVVFRARKGQRPEVVVRMR